MKGVRDTGVTYGAAQVASMEGVTCVKEALACLVLSAAPGNGGGSSCTKKSPAVREILFPTKCLVSCK